LLWQRENAVQTLRWDAPSASAKCLTHAAAPSQPKANANPSKFLSNATAMQKRAAKRSEPGKAFPVHG